MLLEKLNKLFDDAFLYEDDIEEDEKGEYVEMFEVFDCLKDDNQNNYTVMTYTKAINKMSEMALNFKNSEFEYYKNSQKEIRIYITLNKYYINEERDGIIDVEEEESLLTTELRKSDITNFSRS